MRSSPKPDEATAPERPIAKAVGDGAWIGRVLCGKYQVEAVLGRGGMGLVLKARHLRLDEPVAIKVLHSSRSNDPEMSARMLREARASLRLSSEHIVRVMDVDTLEDGLPFIVMEYLDGSDVASIARMHGGRLPWEYLCTLMEQACRALVEAHAIGVIHRDLKPANLFVVTRPDGRKILKLLDFGISKLSEPRLAPITRQGDILGSPRYMSPEQVRGEPLDGRADIWSAGVVLYELLSGKPAFGMGNFVLTCQSVLTKTPESLAALCPDVPRGLCEIVERCLQKDREGRFSDAATLRDALVPFGLLGVRTGSMASLPNLSPDLSLINARPLATTSSSVPPSGAPPSHPLETPSPATPPLATHPIATRRIENPESTTSKLAEAKSASTSLRPSAHDVASESEAFRLENRATPNAQRRPLLWIVLASAVIGALVAMLTLLRSPTDSPPKAAPGALVESPLPITATSSADPSTSSAASIPSASTNATAKAAAAPTQTVGTSEPTLPDSPPASNSSRSKPNPAPKTPLLPTDPFGERRK